MPVVELSKRIRGRWGLEAADAKHDNVSDDPHLGLYYLSPEPSRLAVSLMGWWSWKFVRANDDGLGRLRQPSEDV